MTTHSTLPCIGLMALLAIPAQAALVNVGSGGVAFADSGTSTGVTAFGWIRDDDAATLKGGTTSFIGTAGSQDFRGYVGFDLSGFSTGDIISTAVVSLFSQGADTFDANGPSTTDANDIDLLLTGWAGATGVTGYGNESGNDATINGGANDGLAANFTNLITLYGAAVATAASTDLDTLAIQDEIQFDVTSVIQAAIAAGDSSISFGIHSPEAIATGARNFYTFGGMSENGAAGNDIAPNLAVNVIPEPGTSVLFAFGALGLLLRRRK